ncbi:hypothetical protein NDA13_002640 [Ustilago tritici]|nr:hypothetical protein NDA13_002640 [Ustilago tritici]
MACTTFKCAAASAAIKSAHKVRDTCNVFSQVRHTSNVQSWANTAFKHAFSCHPLPPRPNTLCKLPIFDVANSPASVSSLQLRLWSRFLDLYPDQTYADQLRGALRHGARLGYEGPLRSATRLDVPNLPLDNQDVFHLC